MVGLEMQGLGNPQPAAGQQQNSHIDGEIRKEAVLIPPDPQANGSQQLLDLFRAEDEGM